MRRTGNWILLSSLLLLLLSGCGSLPYPREMGDMAMVRTLGVDLNGGKITLTASTGTRAEGLQGETKEPLTLTAQSTSLSGARSGLQSQSGNYVFFGYVDQLLFGEDLARCGITRTLDYVARDAQLSLGAQLWIIRGAAGAAAGSGEEGPQQRLETLQEDGESGTSILPRSTGEVYADLLERGAVWVPALRADPQTGSLSQAGYAVFQGDTLVGYLDGDAARGLELLEGKPPSGILEVSACAESVCVQIRQTSTKVRWNGDNMEISMKVTAEIMEYGRELSDSQQDVLCQAVESRLKEQIQQALESMCAWNADCTGLIARAALWNPELRDESDLLNRADPNVSVRTALQR